MGKQLCRSYNDVFGGPVGYDPTHRPAADVEVVRIERGGAAPIVELGIAVRNTQGLSVRHPGVPPPIAEIARQFAHTVDRLQRVKELCGPPINPQKAPGFRASSQVDAAPAE